MKKQEKIDVIGSCISRRGSILRTRFEYDSFERFYYPNAVSDKLFLGQEWQDFQLDGYHIRKLSDLNRAEMQEDVCCEISRWSGVTDGIRDPEVDITSWASAFMSLMEKGKFVIAENDFEDGYYFIGLIRDVKKSSVLMETFDSNGIWYSDKVTVPFSRITHVAWDTRYSETWYRYLREKGNIPGVC